MAHLWQTVLSHVGKPTFLGLILFGLIFSPIDSARGGVIIDTFSHVESGDPDVLAEAVGGVISQTFLADPTLIDPLGGYRFLYMSAAGLNPSSITVDGTSGNLSLSTGPINSLTWILEYSANGGDLHFNALAEGADSFRLTFDVIDPGATVTIDLLSAGNGNRLTKSMASVMDFRFADFSAGPFFDFSTIRAIEITFSHGNQFNTPHSVVLTQFETVPEPGFGALLLAGGMAVMVRRRVVWMRR